MIIRKISNRGSYVVNTKVKNQLEDFYYGNVWEDMTLGEALTCWSKIYKDNVAVLDNEIELTYQELNIQARKLACGFCDNGFKKGDKIILQVPNSWEFVVISFALFKIGVVPIMALPAHRRTEIKGIIEKSNAAGYIIKDKYLGFDYRKMAREIFRETNEKIKVIVIGDNEKFQSFDELPSDRKLKKEERQVDSRQMGLLLLSGGTTGIPKLIPRRHTDYLYVAKETAKRCQLDASSIYLVALPISHNFPLCCPGLLGTLSAGGKVVICNTTSPDEIIPLIEKEKVTITSLVPAMANMCMEFLKYEDNYDLSSLEIIQVGGSVLDSSLAEKIEKTFGCKLQQIFGIAEGLICCTSLGDRPDTVYHTQGKPISAYDEVLIVDENGNELPDEEYGELIVRGPYTIYEYYNLDKINKKCITKDCYFRTGDKARKLEDGNYQVVGRLEEIINRAGEKIIPSEIEKLLLKHKSIHDIQVVGIPDDSLGERICAFILDEKEKPTLNEIRNYLIGRGVATFKLPDQLIFIKNWPLTSVGKIDKIRLKKMGQDKFRRGKVF